MTHSIPRGLKGHGTKVTARMGHCDDSGAPGPIWGRPLPTGEVALTLSQLSQRAGRAAAGRGD